MAGQRQPLPPVPWQAMAGKASYDQTSPAMASNGWPWLAIAGHGRAWPVMRGHGGARPAVASNGQPLLTIAQPRLAMAGNGAAIDGIGQ